MAKVWQHFLKPDKMVFINNKILSEPLKHVDIDIKNT